MKVCIIGNSLTSLALAKCLVNREIFVDVLCSKKTLKLNPTRTLGISKSNIEFFKKNISNLTKIAWQIKKIEIYSENSNNDKIIEFEDKNNNLFYILQNYKIVNQLTLELKKNKFFNFKKNVNYKNLIKNGYDLIINCDFKHEITNMFFSKKFSKKYNSIAYTTIINHKEISNNNVAKQIFTKRGPLAFLPVSKKKTSIVYSARIKNFNDDLDFSYLIRKFNSVYEIERIDKISTFDLKSFNLRKYYFNNILAFGDLLHKIHPLAGQGFNMSIRDIKELLRIIDSKIQLGLPINQSVCSEFQKRTKSRNLIFSEGIDFIYEFFNSENKLKSGLIDTTVKFVGKNKLINRYFKKFADIGLQI